MDEYELENIAPGDQELDADELNEDTFGAVDDVSQDFNFSNQGLDLLEKERLLRADQLLAEARDSFRSDRQHDPELHSVRPAEQSVPSQIPAQDMFFHAYSGMQQKEGMSAPASQPQPAMESFDPFRTPIPSYVPPQPGRMMSLADIEARLLQSQGQPQAAPPQSMMPPMPGWPTMQQQQQQQLLLQQLAQMQLTQALPPSQMPASAPPPGSWPTPVHTAPLRRDHRNLMGPEEVQNIIRVQLAQANSGNPYVDDFYFQAYLAKRNAQARRDFYVPVVLDSQPTAPRPAFVLEGVLGRPQGASIRAPRPLLQVLQSRPEHNVDDEAEQVMNARAVRLAIEDCMNHVFEIVDATRTLESPAGQKHRDELVKMRQTANTSLFSQLGVPLLDTEKAWNEATTAQDIAFVRVLAVPKGRRMLTRALPVLAPAYMEAVLAAICRNLHTIIFVQNIPEDLTAAFMVVASRLAQVMQGRVCTGALQSLVRMHTPEQVTKLLSSRFAAPFIACILLRGSEVRDSKDEKKWNEAFEALYSIIHDKLAQLALSTAQQKPDTVEWVFDLLAGCAANMSVPRRLQLLRELRPLLKQRIAESPSPSLRSFMHRMRDGVQGGELLIELSQLA